MIIYIIKWSFIYVILIFLLHNLYLFFQNNLTSTKIKDYYNTYNGASNNNSQIKNIKEKKVMFPNNLQISSTSLEDLNKYSDFANHNNGITNDMTSELSEFLNNLKL